jgi:hypothetical protein
VPSTKPRPATHTTPADSTRAVDAFMQQLNHPMKPEIEAIRRLILGADSSVAEGIKWNAPSFRTSEYFATMNLRVKSGVSVILHLGAKVRQTAITGIPVDDPDGLLTWLAKDRASVVFTDGKDFKSKAVAFKRLLKQWLTHV